MSQAIAPQNSVSSLTALLVPLADRTLLLPNVAVAELIGYQACTTAPDQPPPPAQPRPCLRMHRHPGPRCRPGGGHRPRPAAASH